MKLNLLKYLPLVLLFSACGDDFLNEQPYGPVTEETFAATTKGCDGLLIAAYSSLDGYAGWDNGSPWASAASNWVYGSIAGGDAYKGSEANDQPDIAPIERHEMTSNNPYMEGKFKNQYDAIFRCNKAISSFQKVGNTTEEYRNLRIAEAKFLRAHYHFEAKRMWNKVPFVDETIEELRVPNDKDIYPNIEGDLRAAVDVLPVTQPEIGRATKGAAQAMLGKVLLYQGKYAEALSQFNAVISSGKYALAAKYHDNFNAVTRNNPEGVFEIQQAVNEGTEGDNGNIGDVLNYTHGGGPGGCCGFHQPSQNLVNAFKTDANGLPLFDTYNDSDITNDQGLGVADPFTPTTASLDPRLDWTVGRRGLPYLDWGVHPGTGWIRLQSYGGPYSPKKLVYYKGQEGTLTSASGWTKGYTANNVRLIRYADVLLMAAECEVEVGSLERARELVNQIRTRAANPDGFVTTDGGAAAANYVIGLYNSSWTDKDLARKAVRFERRLELGMEGHRFFDLVRWGVAASEKNAYFAKEATKRTYLIGAQFRAGINEYYPIPRRAITLSAINGVETLVQNPGY